MKNYKKKMVLGGSLYNTSKAFNPSDNYLIQQDIIAQNQLAAQSQQPVIQPTGPSEADLKKQRLAATGTGALSGAAAGTSILPGWGTAIGAVVGGAAGYIKSQGKYGGMLSDQMMVHQGPSHNEGGISRNSGVELEGDEGEYNGMVFSTINGYSDKFKKIKSKYKNRDQDDKLAKQSMEKEIQSLFQMQESDPVILEGREKMMYGGKMKGEYGIDPNTGLQQPTMQYDQNGNLIPFQGGVGFDNMQGIGPLIPSTTNPQLPVSAVEGYGVLQPSRIEPRGLEQLNPELAKSNQMITAPNVKPQERSLQTRYPDTNISPAGALMSSIGPVSQLIGSTINREDDVNFARVNPQEVDYSRTEQILDRNAASARRLNVSNVRNNATSSGQLLSNLVAGNVGINSNLNEQVAKLRESEDNTNVGIRNQANYANTDIANNEAIARQQNKAAYRQAVYGALTDIGNIGAGYKRDNAMLDAQTTMNNRILDTLNSSGSRYGYYLDENMNIKMYVKDNKEGN